MEEKEEQEFYLSIDLINALNELKDDEELIIDTNGYRVVKKDES